MQQLLLINVSGVDRPGLTVALTEVLARYRVEVLDIGQAVIHEELAWGMLVRLPADGTDGPLYKDLVLRAHELGLQIRFSPIDEAHYRRWVHGQGQGRYVVTLLTRTLTAAHLRSAARLLAAHGLNIDRIERLSGGLALDSEPTERRTAVELLVKGQLQDEAAMRGALLGIAHDEGFDIAIQADDIYRRNRRVVCFDMDSTLVTVEIIDELAAAAGVGAEVAALTARAMAGELDFESSFRARVRALAGLPEAALEAVARDIELTEGAERLIAILKALDYRVAIISGGFAWFAERLARRLAIDYVHANELEIVDGRLSGRVVGPVIDGARKAELLRDIAEREGVSLAQTIAVGDGANDLPMLKLAGLGVAFHAKPVVRAHARHAIATLGLDGLLYLLGVRDDELHRLAPARTTMD